MTTFATPALNSFQFLARQLIRHAKASLLIPFLQQLHGTETAREQQQFLQSLPPGTLGRDVADMLTKNNLQLIPHYEGHDLKHALLGYDMTPEDELKLKAFMFGNGDWSPLCVGFLLLAVLTPELWPELRQHYHRGQQTQPVVRWQIAEYAIKNTIELRCSIGLPVAEFARCPLVAA